MRAFSFHPGGPGRRDRPRGRDRGPRPGDPARTASPFLLLALLVLLLPPSLRGQWPPEVRGRVVDAVTGQPVSGARVRADGTGHAAETGGGGRFRIRGLEPGAHTLVATALGYADGRVRVELENGRVARPELTLSPSALPVAGVRVSAEAVRSGERTLDRSAVEETGARTVGELLDRMPGVTVADRGPGGRETVRIRGEDAVLVLLDGAPVNDPVTGEADLSTISAGSVERLTVLPGARSARFGPRAQGGVVLVETRSEAQKPTATVGAGSLGRRSGRVRMAGEASGATVGAGAEYERLDGGFDFGRPEGSGGGTARRRNADARRLGLRSGGGLDVLEGRLRLDAGYEELERGLPGKSFAPSDSARERNRRLRASASWRRAGPDAGGSLVTYALSQRLRVRDPDPPFGPAFDERTDMTEVGLRAETALRPGWEAPFPEIGGGLEVARRSVRSESLSPGSDGSRTDLGAWLRAELDPGGGPLPRLVATVRADRAGPGAGWYGSHEVLLRSAPGPFSLHLAHRSAFSPPTLGDQYFREGVAVRPNPDLRAERVPGELESGVTYRERAGPALLEMAVTAFTGDVQDMIVWAPDYRFVWSPRNVDADRDGVELRGSVGLPGAGVHVDGSFTRARVVYDRDGGGDVQLRYRPRHTGSVSAAWERGGLRVGLEGRYVGRRNTVPAPVNALPGFWTVDLDLRRRWRWSAWELELAAHVDRLLDRTDPFIFAFPEPGRTLDLELRIRTPRP